MKKAVAVILAIALALAFAAPAFAAEYPAWSELGDGDFGHAEAWTLPRGLNLRTGPGLGFSIIGVLPRGTALTVWGLDGGWLNVSAPNGLQGWVHSNYVGILGWARRASVSLPAASESVESRVLSRPRPAPPVKPTVLTKEELTAAALEVIKGICSTQELFKAYYDEFAKGWSEGDHHLKTAIEAALAANNQSYDAKAIDLDTIIRSLVMTNDEIFQLLATALANGWEK